MNRERQREIMREDAIRRTLRNTLDDAILGIGHAQPNSDRARIAEAKPHSFANECLVRPIGVVSPKDVRVSERWKGSMGTRIPSHTVGIAPGTEEASDGTATVRVIHSDGSAEIRSAFSFRSKRTYSRATRTVSEARTPETASVQHHHDFNS